jgi:hypothetical protein
MNPVEIIDDDYDDDVQEISSLPPLSAPLYAAPRETSVPRSTGSGTTTTGSGSHAQSVSAFGAVDMIVNPRRKKNRKKVARRTSQVASAAADCDEIPSSSEEENSRVEILNEYRQIPSKSLEKSAHLAHATGETASRYFPKPRINESTSDARMLRMEGVQGYDKLLRAHRRAEASLQMQHDPIIVSGDELAGPNTHTAESRQDKKHFTSTQTANSGAKRKANTKPPKDWPLRRARMVSIDWIETTPAAELFLICSVKPWIIVKRSTGEEDTIEMEIDPGGIVIAQVDGKGRTRLEGPRPNGRLQPMWDLDFNETKDYELFVESHLQHKVKLNFKNEYDVELR